MEGNRSHLVQGYDCGHGAQEHNHLVGVIFSLPDISREDVSLEQSIPRVFPQI